MPGQALTIRRQAAALLALHVFRHEWTVRRIDTTTLDHDRHLRWRTTLEICIPEGLAAKPDDYLALPELPLPILVRHKRLATGFEVTDEKGRPVTTLTWIQSRPIIVDMLRELARGAIRSGTRYRWLNRQIGECLAGFAEDAVHAGSAMEQLNAFKATGTRQQAIESAALLDDPLISRLLIELQAGYYVIALLPLQRGVRRSINLSHEEAIDPEGVVLAAGAAPSYHAEVRLPLGVRFRALRVSDIHPAGEPNLEWRSELRDDLLAIHALPTYASATLTVRILDSVHEPSWGFADKTWAVSVVTAAVFIAGFVVRSPGAEPETAAAALVVALPTAYAAILLQEARSNLEDKLRAGPRRILVAVAFLTYVGALTLATTFPKFHLTGPVTVPIVNAHLALPFVLGWRSLIWTVTGVCAVMLAGLATFLKLRRW